jgi:hypothetical protein
VPRLSPIPVLAVAPLIGGLAIALFLFGLTRLELVSRLVCPADFDLVVLESRAHTAKRDLVPEWETDHGEEVDFECRSEHARRGANGRRVRGRPSRSRLVRTSLRAARPMLRKLRS